MQWIIYHLSQSFIYDNVSSEFVDNNTNNNNNNSVEILIVPTQRGIHRARVICKVYF